MKTPVDVLLAVAAIGGKLGILEGNALRTLLPRDCPPALKDAISTHKPGLLVLLRATFLVVRADAIKGPVLWTPDEANRALLIASGAEPGIIYTAAELEQLVYRRIPVEELPLIHAVKKRFNGNLTGL